MAKPVTQENRLGIRSDFQNILAGRPGDPLLGFRFRVSITDSIAGGRGGESFTNLGFSRISGLGQVTKVVRYVEGINGVTVHKLPGETEFNDVTLEKGKMLTDSILLNWANQIRASNPSLKVFIPDPKFMKTVQIAVLDPSGKFVQRMHTLTGCWPREYSTSDLDASQSVILVDKLVLAVNGMTESTFTQESRFRQPE